MKILGGEGSGEAELTRKKASGKKSRAGEGEGGRE